MKRFHINTAVIVVLLVVLLTSVGGCVTRSAYDELQGEFARVSNESERLLTSDAQLRREISVLEEAQRSLSSGLNSSRQQHSDLREEHAAVQMGFKILIAEYEYILSQELGQAVNERDALRAVCPPRHFLNLQELQDWLATDNVSESEPVVDAPGLYAKALQIQYNALKDGLIVSANFDFDLDLNGFRISCVAILQNTVWQWDPEDDDYQQYFGFGLIEEPETY